MGRFRGQGREVRTAEEYMGDRQRVFQYLRRLDCAWREAVRKDLRDSRRG